MFALFLCVWTELFDLVDRDNSGAIAFSEFESFWRQRERTIGKPDDGTLDKAKQIFSELDDDGNGSLDRDEFKMIMTELVASDWTAAVDRSSGRTYYVNLKTRATRWAPPGEKEADDLVKEHLGGDGGGGAAGGGGGAAAARGGGRNAAASSSSSSSSSASTAAAKAGAKGRAAAAGGGSGAAPPQHLDSSVLTVDGLFTAVDTDGSGTVSFSEFEAFWRGRQRAIGQRDDGAIVKMKQIFIDLDEDGSGCLDRTEFKLIMVQLAIDEWIAATDPASQRMYYVHKKTREARWVPPGDADADQFVAAHLGTPASGGGGGGGGGGRAGGGAQRRGSSVSSAAASAASSPPGSLAGASGSSDEGVEASTIAELFSVLDTSSDGLLDFAEFETWVSCNCCAQALACLAAWLPVFKCARAGSACSRLVLDRTNQAASVLFCPLLFCAYLPALDVMHRSGCASTLGAQRRLPRRKKSSASSTRIAQAAWTLRSLRCSLWSWRRRSGKPRSTARSDSSVFLVRFARSLTNKNFSACQSVWFVCVCVCREIKTDRLSGRKQWVNSVTREVRTQEPGIEEAEEWLADRTGWVGDESEAV
jgi:Ca2+-binding EF-hand superfamily protein